MRYNQFYCRNFEYYGDNQYNWNNGPFDVYLNIKNIKSNGKGSRKDPGNTSTPYHTLLNS